MFIDYFFVVKTLIVLDCLLFCTELARGHGGIFFFIVSTLSILLRYKIAKPFAFPCKSHYMGVSYYLNSALD